MAYSWSTDEDLLAALERFFQGAHNPYAAGTKLKIWLSREHAIGRATAQRGGSRWPLQSVSVSGSEKGSREHPIMQTDWLTRKEAAAYVKLSPKTLANWYSAGLGPPVHTVGGIKYRMSELEAWLSHQDAAKPVPRRT